MKLVPDETKLSAKHKSFFTFKEASKWARYLGSCNVGRSRRVQ